MKVSLDFNNIKDTALAGKFRGIGVKMKKNIHFFPSTPVDLDKFIKLIDDYDHAIIVASDGSRTAIAQRNKLRLKAVKLATYLGHYVEHVSGDDLEIVYASGFEPANKYRLLKLPLPKTGVNKVVRGPNSGTGLAYLNPIPRKYGKVAYYELGFAEKKDDKVGELTIIPKTVARFPIPVKNLKRGSLYIFQARARNDVGVTDWSDPLEYIAT